ncbi:MAG: Spy/CpxP family protein refolding chaperone [Deltaproteobacteria bacterium]|nr:Spy/CpxP family protein refolding chaperone [Deltaproteobacteria bacterium]
MIGLAIGALALSGLMFHKVRRFHAYARGYGHGMHAHHGFGGPFGHPMGFGPPPWMMGRRARMYALLAELDLTPAQDKVVRAEFHALRERMAELRGEPKQTRADLGRAIGGAVFDRAALEEAFARHDRTLGDLRAQVIGALERVHAVLDDGQRTRLAEIIDRGHRGSWGHGPYRG